MNIDEMEAGRELDALIAKQVFDKDLRVYECPHEKMAFVFCVCPELPRYSTNIAAAWEVVEKLNSMELGWFSLEQFGEKGQGIWRAMIWTGGEEEHDSFFGDANTVSLAICRAALKAAGMINAQPT